VVPIPDKVAVARLDQGHGRESLPPLYGRGNCEPAVARHILEGIKVAIKVVGTALTAQDAVERDNLQASVVTTRDLFAGQHALQAEQAVPPAQHPPALTAAPLQGALVQRSKAPRLPIG
jgi:hypothetical protein